MLFVIISFEISFYIHSNSTIFLLTIIFNDHQCKCIYNMILESLTKKAEHICMATGHNYQELSAVASQLSATF